MKIPINIFYWLLTKTKKLVFLVLIALPVLTLAQTDNDNLLEFSADEINEYFTEEMGLTYQNHIAKGNTHTLIFNNEENDFTSFFSAMVMYNSDYTAIMCITFGTGSKEVYSIFMNEVLKKKEEKGCKYEVYRGVETFICSDVEYWFKKEFDPEIGGTFYSLTIYKISEMKNIKIN